MSPVHEPNRTVLPCPPVVKADWQRNFIELSVWKRVGVEGVGFLEQAHKGKNFGYPLLIFLRVSLMIRSIFSRFSRSRRHSN